MLFWIKIDTFFTRMSVNNVVHKSIIVCLLLCYVFSMQLSAFHTHPANYAAPLTSIVQIGYNQTPSENHSTFCEICFQINSNQVFFSPQLLFHTILPVVASTYSDVLAAPLIVLFSPVQGRDPPGRFL